MSVFLSLSVQMPSAFGFQTSTSMLSKINLAVRVGLFTLFFLSSFNFLEAQSSFEQQTRAQFSENTNLQWLKHFKGRLNDFNDVAIVLGFDGMICKGILQYLRSGEQFKLSGVLQNDQLILKEIDQNENISGYINGNLKKNSFEGTWSNFDNSIGSSLVFQSANPQSLIPSYCGTGKWMRRYTAVSKNNVVELSMQKLQGDAVNGMIYLKKENISYQMKGQWSEEEGLNLSLIDDYGNNVGKLRATNPSMQGFKGFLSIINRKITPFDFMLSAKLNAGCLEFSDYYSAYDIIFPKTANGYFNKWIEELVREEVVKFNNRNSKVTAQIVSMKPENRAIVRSNGWFEIGFFNDNLLSGILVMQSTVSQRQRAISVNFDLTNNRSIVFEDIFREEYDLEYFVENVIRKEFLKHALYQNDPVFKKWIQSVSFPHMILLRNGIYFSSDFNAIYGRQGVTIPYDKLNGFIRKDSEVDFSFKK